MQIEKITKQAFTVVGRQGSTKDGVGFIARLWGEANEHFGEIAPFVKKDENGTPIGFWGAMSDFSLSFRPWENVFSEGLYLAGAEVEGTAEAPEGWTKWQIPGYVYLRVKVESPDVFPKMIEYLAENELELVGAVHDFTDPKDGQNYMWFPIEKITYSKFCNKKGTR